MTAQDNKLAPNTMERLLDSLESLESLMLELEAKLNEISSSTRQSKWQAGMPCRQSNV